MHFFTYKTWHRLVLLGAAGLYIAASTPSVVRNAVTIREGLSLSNPFSSTKYRFGDLYGLSFLPAFRLPYHIYPTHSPIKKSGPGHDLCILGDSYTLVAQLQPESFHGIDQVRLVPLDDVLKNTETELPEPTKPSASILVIETTERLVRDRFGVTRSTNSSVTGSPRPVTTTVAQRMGHLCSVFLDNLFSGTDISFGLETLLFDYTLFRPLKEAKAAFVYACFGRISERVLPAPDGHRLYLKETVTGTTTSSFSPIDSVQLSQVVLGLNHLHQCARQRGYSDVFLSIIPNPVSVIETSRPNYNHLIEQIEHHPGLSLKVISLYDQFRTRGHVYYHPSDTHWNQNGVNAWVSAMNQSFTSSSGQDAF
ncbi:hypothetical protein [Spirosoma radiotolerans]|uniref:AlgX/AlgJ SGNH hydrolase-like domain-containing protein n=1 Tax=Spirosoma radiotolerans TaxID=1379870 RepID=A0A0E3V7D5_9BACT|nr:hypothetical protein [Spirosoma radiotolerans]AKD55336.1 hypothetical protein SD10_10935 [Spirosoma radiotolerans]